MGIFDIFLPGKIRKKWTFQADGSIWRILFSENGLIVGEDRDGNAKTVRYFCLDEHTGKALWLGRKIGREWWSGIEAIPGNLFFVHSFASPEMPEHKGIIAVDTQTGETLWENPNVRFLTVDSDSVTGVGDSITGSKAYRCALRTGEILEELDGVSASGARQSACIDERHYKFPDILTPDDREADSTISRHIRPEDLVGSVEYIRCDETLLFNFHEKNAHSTPQQVMLNNNFRIVSRANEHILFADTLNADVSYPVPDSFFIHDETLYYIKDRSLLTAIQL